MEQVFPRNLIHDPQHVLDGMLVLRCPFCGEFKTPIEFDMDIHLWELHKEDLVMDLPLKGKGFKMDYRIRFAIDAMKQNSAKEYYDNNTAKFGTVQD